MQLNVIIVDGEKDAVDSMDTESERYVRDVMGRLKMQKPFVVIAHRLSTIQHADEIIILQKGEIAEHGKRAELIGYNYLYKKLCELQSFN